MRIWRRLRRPYLVYIRTPNHVFFVNRGPNPCCVLTSEVTEEDVDRVKLEYYAAGQALFEEHKDACGCPDMQVVGLVTPIRVMVRVRVMVMVRFRVRIEFRTP